MNVSSEVFQSLDDEGRVIMLFVGRKLLIVTIELHFAILVQEVKHWDFLIFRLKWFVLIEDVPCPCDRSPLGSTLRI